MIFSRNFEKIVRKIHGMSLNVKDVPYISEEVYFEFTEKCLTIKGKIIESLTDNSVTTSCYFCFVPHLTLILGFQKYH